MDGCLLHATLEKSVLMTEWAFQTARVVTGIRVLAVTRGPPPAGDDPTRSVVQ